MSKRVSITYSIKFDETLKHVGDLLYKKHNKYKALDKDFNTLFSALAKENEKEAIETIEKLRTSLYDVDSCLDDCNNILVGYAQELFSFKTPETPETPEEVFNEDR
tara:strand:+ start:734 stop:1051 length:318 start_codon:yes stop_codon:yes gene_type:complete